MSQVAVQHELCQEVVEEEIQSEVEKTAVRQNILETVQSPHDIKDLSLDELNQLSKEIRSFLIDSLARTGGHLAPNLGIVETTLAIHKVFDLPRDELIFDVGHQAYVHKILTGRTELFDSLRQYQGLSGFTHVTESVYDLFTTGHGGTSISSAIGRALARDNAGKDQNILALIGDGALTEGMALEAINHLGHLGSKLIIVLNDNGMSIAPNVGGFSRYFDKVRDEPHIRSSKEYLKHLVKEIPQYGTQIYQLMSTVKNSFKYLWTPGIIFEELGIRYFGPVDGHNVEELIDIFEEIKGHDRPTILHVRTTKGKGFEAAEDTTSSGAKWHGGGPFCPKSQTFIKKSDSLPGYNKVFGTHLAELARKDDAIQAITAAMPDGTGLTTFASEFPERFYDVAMAEQHAVTVGAGLASSGSKPFVAIYSTFLQRGYDQIIHDVCLQNLPVRICMDRAGLVGADGPTHHGVFDLAYLRCLPNMVLMAPRDENQFVRMLNSMADYNEGPTAIRYPRGAGKGESFAGETAKVEIGKAELLKEGKDITLFALGTMVDKALKVAELLQKEGIHARVVDARFVKPLDEEMLKDCFQLSPFLVTLEEGVVSGGFGTAVLEWASMNLPSSRVFRVGIPDEFVTHGAINNLYQEIGMTDDQISTRILNWRRSQ